MKLLAALRPAPGVVRFIWRHQANKHRRFRQLARAASFQVRARLFRHRVQAQIGANGRIWVDLHRHAASMALYANPPNWPQMLVWQRHLRAGDLFLDVGANVGTYTVLAADLGASVIAVEAAADAAALLRENVTLNGFEDVTVVEAAAGASVGRIRFTEGLDSLNHIDPTGAVEVDQVTLDSLIGDRRVAGLKVDVEGFELDIMKGATRALAEHRIDLMQLEWVTVVDWASVSLDYSGTSRKPLVDLLATYDYELLYVVDDGRLSRAQPFGELSDVFAAPAPQHRTAYGADRLDVLVIT
jgi:FkbM family methyltransferase